MIVDTYRGYELRIPESGGKAGKGYNTTSSIQVLKRQGMYMRLFWQTRFQVHNVKSQIQAIARARKKIDELEAQENESKPNIQ